MARWLIATAWVLLASTAEGAHYRVPEDYVRLGDALAASTDGDVISVGPGTYSPSSNGETFPLVLGHDVIVCGSGMDLSIIDAEGTAGVMELWGTAPRVTGFTITGGNAAQAGGLLVAENTRPEIDHNLVFMNGALSVASGVLVSQGATPHFHHNVFWENFDVNPPSGGDPHGLYFLNANGVVEQNLFGRGDSNGLHLNTSTVTIRNNIFYENGITGVRGRGICAVSGALPVIAHNVFHGNVVNALLLAPSAGDVSGAQANDLSDADGIFGNLDADPAFTDPDAFDWSLRTGSPAIDAGDPAGPQDPDGTPADVGPFHYPQPVSEASVPETPFLELLGAPNPFSASTALRYTLPVSSRVLLHILDVAGREVVRLREGEEASGIHVVTWNGRSASGLRVAPGIYTARLLAGAGRASRPLVLIR